MDSTNSKERLITKANYIIIGLFMVSCYIGNLGQYTIMSQYIYNRIAKEENYIEKNVSDCLVISNFNHTQNRIQARTAQYNIYAQISCGIPSMIVVLFSGVLSDLYGRKMVILISWVGTFAGTICNVLLIIINGPLWLYIFGQFLSGLGGSYGAMLVGILSLVSDSTGHHNRNFGIIIIEIALGISMIVSQALLGKWLELKSFSWPIITFGLLFSISGIMYFFLKETRSKTTIRNYNIKSYIMISFGKMKKLFVVYSSFNFLLLFSLISFFIHTFNFFGNLSLITVYLFGYPFCWHSGVLGYYRSISTAIVQLGIIFSFFLLKWQMNEIVVIELGFLTNILSKLLFALAPLFNKSTCDYLIYIAGFDLLSGASVSLLRSISSKLVSPEEYGTLFGLMSSLETLSSLLGGVIYNGIYYASLEFYYGFIYFVAVMFLSIAFILMIFYYILKRKFPSDEYEKFC